MPIKLDNNTEYIIKELASAGFSAYAVGGAVRDCLLGREVSDFDIATSALPQEVETVFFSYPVIKTGLKHGTVTLVIDHKPYEITTFRVESDYSDSRHPDSVTFIRDLKSDLARRDFTVNAFAYSSSNGLIDLFGGIADLNNKIIRAVGDPFKRFSEDALRILRALRFASVLGFKIEEETKKAVFELAPSLSKVSPERIYSELKKLLEGKNAQTVITEFLPVISSLISVSGDTTQIYKLPPDYTMRFACICGYDVSESLNFLRADNLTKRNCKLLVESKPIPSDYIALKHYVSLLGAEPSLAVASYRRALFGEDPNCKIEKLLSSGECLFLKDLAIDGNDLSSMGISPKNIGNILSTLLKKVINQEIKNEKVLLCAEAKVIDNYIN